MCTKYVSITIKSIKCKYSVYPNPLIYYSQPKKDTLIALCMKQNRGSLRLKITLLE